MTHIGHNDGPAFPTMDGTGHPGADGMSLRDWFAGQATEEDVTNHIMICDEFGNSTGKFRSPEEAKYRYADAMLAARKGPHSAPLRGVAPDMLDAAKTALKQLSAAVKAHGGDPDTHFGCCDLRAAIARAEGGDA